MSDQNDISIKQLNENVKLKTIGFETEQDLLDEINNRFKLLNKNHFMLQKIPKSLTRISLKDLIPEMITSRFPEASKYDKVNYAFIQLPTEALVNKYIESLNGKVISGKKLLAKKYNQVKINDISDFDLKTLYFNGLKPETKFNEIKTLYPNAKITFPLDNDKNSKGSVTLNFKTQEEAFEAFMQNKMILHGLKCHLNFLIKPKVQLKFSFNRVEELIKEIISRFEMQNNRTVMIKNLPINYTLQEMKELIPTMRNCKLSNEKKIGFIEFDNAEIASNSVKELNRKQVKNSKIRAFVAKNQMIVNDLTNFNLNKLHLTNLSMDTAESDIKSVFESCEIELSKNTDDTCLGNATLSFANSQEALKYFSLGELKVKNVPVIVNFHSQVKAIENKKRKLEDSDEHEVDRKKTKTNEPIESQETNAPIESQETNEPIESQETNEPIESQETNEPIESQETNKPIESQETNKPIESQETKAPIQRKKSFIPKSKQISKVVDQSVKKENKGKMNKTPEIEIPKKSLLPVKKDWKKKSNIKEQSSDKRNSNGSKQTKTEISTTKVVAGKRKFEEIEHEEVGNSIKKKRVIAKAKNNKK